MCGNMIDIDAVIKSETLTELKEILEDDFEVLVSSYLEDARSRLVRLAAAIRESDAPVVKAEAHSLKGSSLNLGTLNLPALCSQLESQGNTGKLEGAPELFSKIETEFSKVEKALGEYSAES